MLYIFGICERCKEPVELKLKVTAMEKNADVTMNLVLRHKPQPIGSAPACGGRIRVISMTTIDDGVMRTMLPSELWQVFCERWHELYKTGMSLRQIADMFVVTYSQVRYQLFGRIRRREAVAMDADAQPLSRHAGRPAKQRSVDDVD